MRLVLRNIIKPLIFIMALLCLKSTFAPLYAQSQTGLRSTITTTNGGKKMAIINGKVQPLFWCNGITRISQLDAYAKCGFNTVVVRLFWGSSANGSLTLEPQDLKPQQLFAQAAAARGLYVIYALPEAPTEQTDQFTFSAANRAYFQMWESWIKGAMQALAGTPNLIGWMLPDDPRGLPYTSDDDFRGWLSQHYAGLPVLNKEWMTAFSDFRDITIEGAETLAENWSGVTPPGGPMSDNDFRAYARQIASRRRGSPNWAFHPAELALGEYRWDAFRALVDRWAQIVHQNDPQHLVFSGRLSDYAELLALPASVDISMPALWPGSAENDLATGNPQAVDIARRGGRFCAMPMLATSLPKPFSSSLVAARLQAWADEAVAHGASGLSLASWDDVQGDPALVKTVQDVLMRLRSTASEDWWQQTPLATTAMLLTPLADGYTAVTETEVQSNLPPMGQWHGPPPTHMQRQERGLYGFCNQLVSDEPSDLVYALRWGTQFGGIDYLSPDDLGGSYSLSRGGVLKKYSTVLLPQALWTPPAMVTELGQYVGGGGVIVADLGIGAAQAGGQVVDLPPALNALLGVIPQRLQVVAFNLTPGPDAGLLPSWSALAANPQSEVTAGDAPGGAAFAGPTTFTQLLPGTKMLGLGFQLPLPLGAGKGNGHFLLQRTWLSAAPQGSGLAVYAPFRLWTHWRPGFRGFDAFHRDIMGRGAALSTLLNTSLVPAPDPAPGALQMFPEMINYGQGIAIINHTPPHQSMDSGASANGTSPGTGTNIDVSKIGSQLAALTTGTLGNFLWRNAMCVFPQAGSIPITAPRPVPAGTPANFTGKPGAMELLSWVDADQTKLLQPALVQVNPTGGTAAVTGTLMDDNAGKLRLMVWPGSDTVLPQNGDFRVQLQGGSARIIIDNQGNDGGYAVAPNSKHQLTITDWSKPLKPNEKLIQQQAVVQADANGHLELQVTGGALEIDLTPAP